MTQTMEAVVISEFGGPGVLRLRRLPPPTPGPGELVVEVAAAGVNFMDIYGREGQPPHVHQLPFVPGAEGAGTVVAVGPRTDQFEVGDPVAWAGVLGSYAQQLLLPAHRAVPVPTNLPLPTAAAVMLQGCTAHYLATATFPVAPGHVVVVHAAAGGVGRLLTAIVRHRGGTVVATTSGGAKADLAAAAGAHHVATYAECGEVVRDLTDGVGADVVFDGVGLATFAGSLQMLRRRGTAVLYGAASGPVPTSVLQTLMDGGSRTFVRPRIGDYLSTRDELLARTADLFRWVADGTIAVLVDAAYPLARASRAHRDLAARRTTGKLLLLPAASDSGRSPRVSRGGAGPETASPGVSPDADAEVQL